jgi:hypothetical protein
VLSEEVPVATASASIGMFSEASVEVFSRVIALSDNSGSLFLELDFHEHIHY